MGVLLPGRRLSQLRQAPARRNGLDDATTDLNQVTRWWQRWPRVNIGLVTGARFDVLDIDGQEGVASLRGLEKDLQLSGPVAQTGGG